MSEDAFLHEQLVERANIRIKQGRENLVDLITKSLLVANGQPDKALSYVDPDAQAGEQEIVLPDECPTEKIRLMTLEEVGKMSEEIENLDDATNKAYWNGLLMVLKEEKKRKAPAGTGKHYYRGQTCGVGYI